MSLTDVLLSGGISIAISVSAYLNARAVSSLVASSLDAPSKASPEVAPTPGDALAGRGSKRSPPSVRSAEALLARNPFDHATGPLVGAYVGAEREADPAKAQPCADIRASIVASADDPSVAIAALDAFGAHVLRRRGGDMGDFRVAHVGRDRVWLERAGALCQAKVFGAASAAPGPPRRAAPNPGPSDDVARDVAGKIRRLSATEIEIDRSAVDRLLEAQDALMNVRVVPDREGDRVVGMLPFGVKPGSTHALLGLESGDRLESVNGIEVTSVEKVIEAYTRLRAGSLDRLTLHVTRRGAPLNLDYVIR